VPRGAFTRAVEAELLSSTGIMSTYEPLHDSPYYRPLGKKTHKLNETYAAADPSRFRLPMCEKAFHETAVNFDHLTLLMGDKDNERLIDAFAKIRENIDELMAFAKR